MRRSGGSRRRGFGLVAVLTAALICTWAPARTAEGFTVDTLEVARETQKATRSGNHLTAVCWFPQELLLELLSGDPMLLSPTRNLAPYTLVAVAAGTIGGTPATVTYESEAEIRERLRAKDSAGKIYLPLDEDSMPGPERVALAGMKPLLHKMAGTLEQNAHVFAFPPKNGTSEPIVAATEEGTFWVIAGDAEFRWRLPLGSLLPPKICPQCQESLSGAFKYCPYDGTKLP